MIYWYVSHVDVERHPEYGTKSLEDILYDYGIDTRRGYLDDDRWKCKSYNIEEHDEYDYCHRALCGEITKGPRYYGLAREDGEWRRFINRHLELPVEFSRNKRKKAV